ncbi:polyketide cyclase [bacterium]|nr:MAG: polyketide cyclase [bacterium]
MKTRITLLVSLFTILSLSGLSQQATAQKSLKEYKAEVEKLKTALAEIAKTNETIAKNLATFDDLDFNVFTNQEWSRLHESHAKNIIVHWPDGSSTKGIERHIEDLSRMFVYAPDTRIKEHPIKIGSGKMTAVMGVMEGTFSKPMPIGEGKFIEPNGKTFKISMVTIGLWNDEGVMYEEYLFWDNLTYMKQLGLAN